MKDNSPSIDYSKLPTPTKTEVEIALEMLSEKYHRAFAYDEAARFISLNKMLKMWEETEKDIESGKRVTKKDIKEIQRYFKDKGAPISPERAFIEAKKVLTKNVTTEMLKITNELGFLVNKQK
jgi:hypothetical protein